MNEQQHRMWRSLRRFQRIVDTCEHFLDRVEKRLLIPSDGDVVFANAKIEQYREAIRILEMQLYGIES